MFTRNQGIEARTIYLILTGVSALLFTMMFTVTAVYRVQAAGLNPFQLVLVGTVLEAAVFLCEIPTGVVADVYSRRLSIIIGLLLIGAGFVLEGALPIFATILLAQVLWGVGATFTSGAQEAWIADEVGEAQAGGLFLRGAQMGQIGAVFGALIGAGLASIQLNLPIVLGGVLFIVLGIVMVLIMPERGFQPTPREERNSWQALGGALQSGARLVRGRPLLVTILGITAFAGMSSEGFDRLWAAHLLASFTFPALGQLQPVAWFGIISVGTMLLALGATEIIRRRLNTRSHRAVTWALLSIDILLCAAIVIFGLAGSFELALAAYWSTAVFRRISQPINTAWLNQNIDSRVRATVLSMNGQADAFGQVAGGPVLGLIGTLVSLRAAMVAAAVALVPALLLYTRALRQGGSASPDGDETRIASESYDK